MVSVKLSIAPQRFVWSSGGYTSKIFKLTSSKCVWGKTGSVMVPLATFIPSPQQAMGSSFTSHNGNSLSDPLISHP